jgi:hypothetical protein
VFADDRVGPCVWRLIHRQQLHRLARSRYWGGQRRCRAAQVMRSTQSAQRRSQPRSAYGGGTERARSPAHAPAASPPGPKPAEGTGSARFQLTKSNPGGASSHNSETRISAMHLRPANTSKKRSRNWSAPRVRHEIFLKKYRRFTGRRYAPNTDKTIEIAKEIARAKNRRIAGAKTERTGSLTGPQAHVGHGRRGTKGGKAKRPGA